MATSTVITSAQPLLALLEEDDVETREQALTLLDQNVHILWSEVASALPLM